MRSELCLAGGHWNVSNCNRPKKIWKNVTCWRVPFLRKCYEQWQKRKVLISLKLWRDSSGWATNHMNWSMMAKQFCSLLKRRLVLLGDQLFLTRMELVQHAIWPAWLLFWSWKIKHFMANWPKSMNVMVFITLTIHTFCATNRISLPKYSNAFGTSNRHRIR